MEVIYPMERRTRLELAPTAWKAVVLPLHQHRIRECEADLNGLLCPKKAKRHSLPDASTKKEMKYSWRFCAMVVLRRLELLLRPVMSQVLHPLS